MAFDTCFIPFLLSTLADTAVQIRSLAAGLRELQPLADSLGVPSPRDREWFELLEHKLVPQVDARPYLVAAVVGGTNIGKSVIFNHLAGEQKSAVSPLAAGTKHPVCLVHQEFADPIALASLFTGFELRPWRSADDAQQDSPRHDLFWSVGRHVPPRLLLLDTPDIDSDAPVNWQRAEHVRQAADVLIAVLTQQKYNDAAVKQFFRKAAAADKAVIVVFNQCDLNEDREAWPQWLATFQSETGCQAQFTYVVPYDRQAAKDLSLEFFEVGSDGRRPPAQPASLRDELASLKFDEIKHRALRGAIKRLLEPATGCPAYLDEIRAAAGRFAAAATALSAGEMARVQWPTLPTKLLVDEIRTWWDEHRSSWSRNIHGGYRKLGEYVTWPFRKAKAALVGGPAANPLEIFHQQERAEIANRLQCFFVELERLAEVGNDILRPRLKRLLSGDQRAEVLRRVEEAHLRLPPVSDDFRRYMHGELSVWAAQSPGTVKLLRSLDYAAAVARPAITVTLLLSGWFVAGGMVHEAAGHAVAHSVGNVAADAGITAGITAGGEAAVDAASGGVRHAAAQLFRRLQHEYADQRKNWLQDFVHEQWVGDLLSELREGAIAPTTPAFRAVEQSLKTLAAGRAF